MASFAKHCSNLNFRKRLRLLIKPTLLSRRLRHQQWDFHFKNYVFLNPCFFLLNFKNYKFEGWSAGLPITWHVCDSTRQQISMKSSFLIPNIVSNKTLKKENPKKSGIREISGLLCWKSSVILSNFWNGILSLRLLPIYKTRV